jgi:Rrf2 family protein
MPPLTGNYIISIEEVESDRAAVVPDAGRRRLGLRDNGAVRLSAKSDYALRAMAELGAHPMDHALKADDIAASQDIPLRFLLGILNELRRARLVTSQRGLQGGYTLARPGSEINLADVIRAVDGPLISVHDQSVGAMRYPGPAEGLRDVWMAVRSSLRSVLEVVTIADLVAGHLPDTVRQRVAEYQNAEAARGRALDVEGTEHGPTPREVRISGEHQH